MTLSPDLARSVLDSAPDAMVMIDLSGKIVFTNRQLTVLFGYEPEEVLGQTIELLLPERFRERHLGHRREYNENLRVRPMGSNLELFARRKDGREFPVEISLSPIVDGEQTLVVAAIRDVTAQRAIQNALREAREAADRANRAKSRFLAMASHDLRQPLQTLSLLNGALRRMAQNPEVTEALIQSEHAINAMSRLLNALLDISKLESGAIKPEVTDFRVSEIFAEMRNEFAGLAAAKGLKLQVEPCTGCVRSDRSLVGQVLRNLVSNAIKYTREGYVQLRCMEGPTLVRLEVLDTGIGIPADALGHICDEFYQVGVPTNTSRDGYGLGLAIVRRIVNLLGARLDIQSEPGKGSRFAVELPASNPQQVTAGARESADARGATTRTQQPHLLLVEDDPGVRNATRMLLKVEGYRVTTASSLEEAVQQAASNPDIQLVITDYHLGDGCTGIDALVALRKQLGARTGAVLITGDTSSAVRELQRDERLRLASKPINADEMLSMVRELLAS